MSSGQGHPLSKIEQLSRLRLSLSQNVGPITFRQLLVMYGTAEKAVEALPELAKRGGASSRFKVFPKSDAEGIFERVEDLEAFLVFLGDEAYPDPLAAIEDAPPFLCGKGHKHLFGKKTLAIVGARNASANGQRFSRDLGGSWELRVLLLLRALLGELIQMPILDHWKPGQLLS